MKEKEKGGNYEKMEKELKQPTKLKGCPICGSKMTFIKGCPLNDYKEPNK